MTTQAQVAQSNPSVPRKRLRSVSLEQIEKVLSLHRQNLHPHEIAKRMLLSPTSIYRVLRKAALAPNPRPRKVRAAKPKRIPDTITLRIAPALAVSLCAMAALTRLPIDQFATQLVESEVAEFRKMEIPKDFLSANEQIFETKLTPVDARRKIDPAKAQKILALLDDRRPVAEIAARFKVSKSTIRRILDARENDDET